MHYQVEQNLVTITKAIADLLTGKSYVQHERDADGDTVVYVRSFDDD